MFWVIGSKRQSSTEQPDKIHNCIPMPPTPLQESTDIFKHVGRKTMMPVIPLHLTIVA